MKIYCAGECGICDGSCERETEVIQPAHPFTTDTIRDLVMKISFGQLDFKELAEELNKIAFNFYKK